MAGSVCRAAGQVPGWAARPPLPAQAVPLLAQSLAQFAALGLGTAFCPRRKILATNALLENEAVQGAAGASGRFGIRWKCPFLFSGCETSLWSKGPVKGVFGEA